MAELRTKKWQRFNVNEWDGALPLWEEDMEFKYLDDLRELQKDREITPVRWLALALAAFKYDPNVSKPYTEHDGISLDEYRDAYEKVFDYPPPAYNRVIREVMKPLQKNGLIFTYKPEWCEHKRNRLTRYAYSLFFPRFPWWDHTKKEHRQAACALVEVVARRACLTFITFHGAKEMEEGEYHADVIIVPPNESNLWHCNRPKPPWKWRDAICGQVVRKPKRNRKQVENAFSGAFMRGRRVLFATWKPPKDQQVETIRKHLTHTSLSLTDREIGYGTRWAWPDEAAIIQPVDLTTPKMEADRRKEEKRDKEIARASLDPDKSVNVTEGYVKIYDKKTQTSKHGGKLTRSREFIIENHEWAEEYLEHEKKEKREAERTDMDEFERLVREETSKPENEQAIRLAGKKVVVGSEVFEGEKFVRRYVEILS